MRAGPPHSPNAPSDRCAPVVGHEDGGVEPEGDDQTTNIFHKLVHRVAADGRRLVGQAVAAARGGRPSTGGDEAARARAWRTACPPRPLYASWRTPAAGGARRTTTARAHVCALLRCEPCSPRATRRPVRTSGKPCRKSMSGPEPERTTWNLMPLAWTNSWRPYLGSLRQGGAAAAAIGAAGRGDVGGGGPAGLCDPATRRTVGRCAAELPQRAHKAARIADEAPQDLGGVRATQRQPRHHGQAAHDHSLKGQRGASLLGRPSAPRFAIAHGGRSARTQ